MVKFTFIRLASVFAFFGCSMVWADPILQPTQEIYTGLNPGDEFTLSFNIVNPDDVTVIAYDFAISANDDNVFSIVSQTLQTPLDQPNYSSAFPYLVPTSFDAGNDFGAYSLTDGYGTGTTLAQSLVFSIDPLSTPGTYTLTFNWNSPAEGGGPNLVYDQAGNIFESQMSEPITITVNVIPEPNSVALLIGGIFMTLFFFRVGLSRSLFCR